jgi:hypothetical protein
MPKKGYHHTKEHNFHLSKSTKEFYRKNPDKTMKGTKRSLESIQKMSQVQKERCNVKGYIHPMLGKHHTKEALEKMSKCHKGSIQSPEARRKNSEAHKGRKKSLETKRNMSLAQAKRSETFHFKGSFREDLQHYVRSSWEANFARILRYFKEPYEYEKHRFDLGNCFYIPDFYLPKQDIFYEIKGFIYEKARRKLIRLCNQIIVEYGDSKKKATR